MCRAMNPSFRSIGRGVVVVFKSVATSSTTKLRRPPTNRTNADVNPTANHTPSESVIQLCIQHPYRIRVSDNGELISAFLPCAPVSPTSSTHPHLHSTGHHPPTPIPRINRRPPAERERDKFRTMSFRPGSRIFNAFRQPLLRRRVGTAAAPEEQSGFAKLWNSPVGPKTVHFWYVGISPRRRNPTMYLVCSR